MANITMIQMDEQNVTAKNDRILYDTAHTNGIIKGCTITYSGGNTIHITEGYGIVKGSLFVIEDHDETITLSDLGTKKGQIYVHLDLSAAEPLTIVNETAATPTVLEQDEDANFTNGVYDIQLCTFDVGTTTLDNLVVTYPLVLGASQLAMDFVSKRTHFNSDGSIVYTYENGQKVVQDFPDGSITRQRLYDANNTLLATKTTTLENATGDIVDTVVKN